MFRAYVEYGWKLCAIDRGKKGPEYPAWQKNPISIDAADAIEGAGLLHALSGTCALDIDDIELARPYLAERGVDLDALLKAPDAVRIHSGRQGRAKLLYRLKKPLRTLKPPRSGIELRCASQTGTSMQDVLPPTVHPDTKKPYEWRYGSDPMLDADWRILPPIPTSLLACWRQLLAEIPVVEKLNSAQHPTEQAHPLEALATWIEQQDPNAGYDEGWIQVGMKLHHATGGSQEGFDLWNAWSAKATRIRKNGRPAYEGPQALRVHWVSFTSPKGKVVATVDNELPASADEFEVITPEVNTAHLEAQIEKDRAKAAQKRAEALAILKDRLVYVIGEERYFDLKHHRIVGSDNAIEHLFTSLMPRKKGVRVNPVKLLKDTGAKQVDKLGFHPGRGAMFKGDDGLTFANNYVNRLPAPLQPTADELARIEWLFGRIENASYRQWFKQFYAHAVQKPGKKIRSVPLLWSEIEGNGKTMLVKSIPALLVGAAYSKEVNSAALNSDFSGHLLNAWHINLAEFRAGTRADRSANVAKLKSWITDDYVPVRAMRTDLYTIPNVFFLTASSNDDDAVPIGAFDRRWGIHRMDVPMMTAAERYEMVEGFFLKPRAAAVLRHYFLNYSLAGFDASGGAPATGAKADMVEASMPRDQELLYQLWEEKAEFFDRDVVIVGDVVQYVHKHTPVKPSAIRIGKLLAKPPINGRALTFRVGTKTFRAVVLRNFSRWGAATGNELQAHILGDDSIDMTQ